MKGDAAVIGAGMSGMTAALLLARAGRRVVLVEQAGHLAPLLSRFGGAGGRFDPGFHYCGGLHPEGGYAPLLRSLGLGLLLEQAIALNPDGFDRLHLPDGRCLSVPVGFDRARAMFSEAFPRSRGAVDSCFARMRACLRSTPFVNPDLAPDDSGPAQFVETSLDDCLRSAGGEDALCATLGTYGSFLSGVSGREAPLALHALVNGSFYESAHTFAGGGDTLVEAFGEQLAAAGVRVLTGCAATGIETDGGRNLRAVRLRNADGDSERLETNCCVSTIHPRRLADLLEGTGVRPAHLTRLRGLEDTYSPFLACYEVADPPAALRTGNHYFFDFGADGTEGPDSFAVLACGAPAPGAPERGLCVLRKAWENGAASGCGALFCRGTAAEPSAYAEWKARMTGESTRLLLEAFPELHSRIRWAASAAPCSFERRTGTAGGSIYGAKHSVVQRPPGPRTPVRGLFLAGQSAGAPGVLGAMISGVLAGSAILGRDAVWRKVQSCR